MSKVINITDRISTVKPTIKIGDKEYEVNDSMETVFKFEELSSKGNKGLLEGMELALGKQAVSELKLSKMSVANFKVMATALLAAMQGTTYEEADARFRQQGL